MRRRIFATVIAIAAMFGTVGFAVASAAASTPAAAASQATPYGWYHE